MSWRVTKWVLDQGPPSLKENPLVVMMALADWANDDGTVSERSLRDLMRRARLQKRATQDILRQLEGRGYIAVKRARDPSSTNTYVILREGLRKQADLESQGAAGDSGEEDGRVHDGAPLDRSTRVRHGARKGAFPRKEGCTVARGRVHGGAPLKEDDEVKNESLKRRERESAQNRNGGEGNQEPAGGSLSQVYAGKGFELSEEWRRQAHQVRPDISDLDSIAQKFRLYHAKTRYTDEEERGAAFLRWVIDERTGTKANGSGNGKTGGNGHGRNGADRPNTAQLISANAAEAKRLRDEKDRALAKRVPRTASP